MNSRVDVTAQRVHALLRLAGGNEGWTVSFDADGDLPLGLKVHSGKRDSFLRTAMRKAGGSVMRNARMVRFEPPQRDEAEEFTRLLFQYLVRVAKEPIGPKVVEKAAWDYPRRVHAVDQERGHRVVRRGAGWAGPRLDMGADLFPRGDRARHRLACDHRCVAC